MSSPNPSLTQDETGASDAADVGGPSPCLSPASSASPVGAATPLLNYAPALDHGTVTVARCAELAEAEMIAGDLEAEGICCTVTNRSAAALGAWGGGALVYVDVPAKESDRAAEVLRLRALGDEVEPAAEDASDPGLGDHAALDDQGRPVPLVVVAAYDRASRMRDAVTTLGAARVRCIVPKLVARGDRPPGEGDRFIVRVRADDLARARVILHASDYDAADDEPRCPACSSWRVQRLGSLWANIGRFFGLVAGSEQTDPFQCLACGHEWPPESRRSN